MEQWKKNLIYLVLGFILVMNMVVIYLRFAEISVYFSVLICTIIIILPVLFIIGIKRITIETSRFWLILLMIGYLIGFIIILLVSIFILNMV
jgi:hypothetical protein